MWCKNCNLETNEAICPVCGLETSEDLPVEIYWCNDCRIPVIHVSTAADKGICPVCHGKTRYLTADLRPVFPEERLLIALLLDKAPDALMQKSVWATGSRYYIDGMSLSISTKTFETADIVIADLPCSGLGVIGRKTDIKYHMTPETIKELEVLQNQILDVCWHYVKPGGTLLYSTCSLYMCLYMRQVVLFLVSDPFSSQSLDDMLPEKLQSDFTAKGFLQLLPRVHDCDGFFVAKLRRNEE